MIKKNVSIGLFHKQHIEKFHQDIFQLVKDELYNKFMDVHMKNPVGQTGLYHNGVLIDLVISMPDYLLRGHDFDSQQFHNFKHGLGLEKGPPSLVWTTGQLLDSEVADLIKKVDVNILDGT